jgi:hypothetical protein
MSMAILAAGFMAGLGLLGIASWVCPPVSQSLSWDLVQNNNKHLQLLESHQGSEELKLLPNLTKNLSISYFVTPSDLQHEAFVYLWPHANRSPLRLLQDLHTPTPTTRNLIRQAGLGQPTVVLGQPEFVGEAWKDFEYSLFRFLNCCVVF